MAFLVKEFNFIYFSAPATGSTAFIRAFQDNGFGSYLPAEDIVKNGRRLVPRKHSTVLQLLDHGLITEGDGLYRVVGIRNPFSFHVAKYLRNKSRRLMQVEDPNSWINKLPDEERKRYVYRIRKSAKQTFGQYLAVELGNKPYEVQIDFHVGINFFIHQEAVDHDFTKLKQELTIPENVVISRVNVTGAIENGLTYKDFYDKDSIELVYKINKPFFDRFPEYSFDGLKPNY